MYNMCVLFAAAVFYDTTTKHIATWRICVRVAIVPKKSTHTQMNRDDVT